MPSDEINFFPEEFHTENTHKSVWRVLIADDDKEIHEITKLALQDYDLYGRKLEFLHSYDTQSTMEVLRYETDISLILLDVVMDEKDSGLKIIDFIRKTLNNNLMRIVLRTGEPGEAPERDVILRYDINDYKEKTELTATKLFSIIHTSLKNYSDLKTLYYSKINLNNMIVKVSEIYRDNSEIEFIGAVLQQFSNLLNTDPDVILLQSSSQLDAVALRYDELENQFAPLIGSGNFSEILRGTSRDVFKVVDNVAIKSSVISGKPVQENNSFTCSLKSFSGKIYVLHATNVSFLDRYDQSIIQVFLSHVTRAIDAKELRDDILKSQFEVIETLGNAVEFRSGEVAEHVQRVSLITEIIAHKLKLPESEIRILKLASTLHDLGKIGISDTILNKPGKLTKDEFEQMKTHAEIGHGILTVSQKQLFKAAAIIAKQHHEKWDGTGYPSGLSKNQIHIYAQIVSLADVYDALRSERSYKSKWSRQRTYDYILENSAKQFSPNVCSAFKDCEDRISILYEHTNDNTQLTFIHKN